jgi:hypothetical protein
MGKKGTHFRGVARAKKKRKFLPGGIQKRLFSLTTSQGRGETKGGKKSRDKFKSGLVK